MYERVSRVCRVRGSDCGKADTLGEWSLLAATLEQICCMKANATG